MFLEKSIQGFTQKYHKPMAAILITAPELMSQTTYLLGCWFYFDERERKIKDNHFDSSVV